MPCKKTFCLKQVNPYNPESGYFGIPFEYDESWFGCYLCRHEDGIEESEPANLSTAPPRFVRTT